MPGFVSKRNPVNDSNGGPGAPPMSGAIYTVKSSIPEVKETATRIASRFAVVPGVNGAAISA